MVRLWLPCICRFGSAAHYPKHTKTTKVDKQGVGNNRESQPKKSSTCFVSPLQSRSGFRMWMSPKPKLRTSRPTLVDPLLGASVRADHEPVVEVETTPPQVGAVPSHVEAVDCQAHVGLLQLGPGVVLVVDRERIP